jgi:hypothetical protein
MTVARSLPMIVVLLLVGCAGPSEEPGGSSRGHGAEARAAEAPEGRWRAVAADSAASTAGFTDEQREEVDRLRSIGYLAGSRPAGTATGVTVHDPARACAGFNLYTSGDFPGAVLMDMDGRVLHRWQRSFRDIWPDDPEGARSENAGYWRRVHLFPNGDVLAIFEGLGLVKLDKDSRVLWRHRGGEHHDMEVRDSGLIFTLTRQPVLDPRISPEHPILEDSVTVLTPGGSVVKSVSVVSAIGNSEYLRLFEGMKAGGDILHTNAIEVLDGSLADVSPGLARGNVLLSIRKLSALVAIDLNTELATWALEGSWRLQHDPSVLSDGNILMFDNNGNDGKSRVIEIDPRRGDVEWSFAGEPPGTFYSQMCGAAERLENGDTLATESDAGRAIEIAPDGDVVWEYMNPERAGEHGELVATLFEMTRLPEDFPLDWLTAPQ